MGDINSKLTNQQLKDAWDSRPNKLKPPRLFEKEYLWGTESVYSCEDQKAKQLYLKQKAYQIQILKTGVAVVTRIIEKKTLVLGMQLNTATCDQLIDLIGKLRAKEELLDSISLRDSTFIDNSLKEISKGLDLVLKELDSRK